MTNVPRLRLLFPPIPYINMCIRNILLFFGQVFLVAKNMLDEQLSFGINSKALTLTQTILNLEDKFSNCFHFIQLNFLNRFETYCLDFNVWQYWQWQARKQRRYCSCCLLDILPHYKVHNFPFSNYPPLRNNPIWKATKLSSVFLSPNLPDNRKLRTCENTPAVRPS